MATHATPAHSLRSVDQVVPGLSVGYSCRPVSSFSTGVFSRSMVALSGSVVLCQRVQYSSVSVVSQDLNSVTRACISSSSCREEIELSQSNVDGFPSWICTSRNRWVYRKNSKVRHRVRCGGGDENGDKDAGRSITTGKEHDVSDPQKSNTESQAFTPSPPSGVESGPNGPVLKNLPHAFSLLELIGPEKVDPDDVKLLKEKVFGYSTFWVTGQEPFGDLGLGVQLFGNLRGKREEVFAKLQSRLKEELGNKYDLFMVEEPNSEDEDVRGGPRISFVLLRSEVSNSGPTSLWQWVIASVLLVITGGTSLELGISAQLSKLPPEVVQYITSPETIEAPDVQLLIPFIDSALPLAYGVSGVQLLHELGHRLAAAPRNVRMGIPYFIPNITLGTFGAITQFKSVCPDRQTKFDISMAGPVSGALLAMSMFGVGLWLSKTAEASSEIVQVPSILFQGSFLLGLISREVLGYNAVHSTTIGIHPLVIAGWCGLTTTALNLLPVGCIDGGRAMQAAFGKASLSVSSLLTYLMLGLGLLGGPLSLPWGLYVLILQRSPEKPCLNDVTDVGSWRKASLLLALLIVISTLLPIWDELAEEIGLGLVAVS